MFYLRSARRMKPLAPRLVYVVMRAPLSSLLPPLALGALLLAGCNNRDRSELTEDATKFGKTVVRSAGNAQLAAQVTARLAQTKGIRAEDVKVESEGGKITLSGNVRTKSEKAKVLELTKELRGVETVKDELTYGQ